MLSVYRSLAPTRCPQTWVRGWHRRAGASYVSHRLVRNLATAESTVAEAVPVEASATPQVPFKAHIDFKYVADNVERLTDNARSRLSKGDPAKVAELYKTFISVQREVDSVRQKRNGNAKAMKRKMEATEREQLIAAGSALKDELSGLEDRLRAVENALQYEAQKLPNTTHPDVPIGGEEKANILRTVGQKPVFDFQPKNHVDIMEALDLVDFDAASHVSGSKFYYLRNAAALIELGLVNMTMQKCVARGFTPMMTPDLVREAVLEKCGFQPRMDNTQTYSIEQSDLCLTGTAEVPLGGVYMDEVVEQKKLPIRMAAFGRCFRTEAGAGGMAGKGLYRVHQFSKVEMFVVCTPEQSEELLHELIAIEEELFTELGLHFHVIDMPSGDLGAPAYRKLDVEAWMPGLNRYGEISSASNCTDYQARRLNIRYRVTGKPDAEPASGERQKKKQKRSAVTAFCHTLNATACAVPRMIVAIVENYQQPDGSVIVPEALQPYLGGLRVIER